MNEKEAQNGVIVNAEFGGVGLSVTSDKKIDFGIGSTLDGSTHYRNVDTYDSDELVLSEWYTVVGKLENNKLSLYVDGVKKDEEEFQENEKVKTSIAPFIIGANPGGNPYVNHAGYSYFYANMEFTDALFFDRALSEEEIEKEFSGEITNISNKSKMLFRYDLNR